MIEHRIEPAARFSFGGQELWQYRELFLFFTWRDIKVRYKQATLGILWALIQPLSMMVLFTFIFGRGLRLASDELPYSEFLFQQPPKRRVEHGFQRQYHSQDIFSAPHHPVVGNSDGFVRYVLRVDHFNRFRYLLSTDNQPRKAHFDTPQYFACRHDGLWHRHFFGRFERQIPRFSICFAVFDSVFDVR
jgi:hypothetical protein